MEHRIETTARLRELIGEPSPPTIKKVLTRLDGEAIHFIARSPFLVMGTVDENGIPEVSPKGDEPGFVRVVDELTLLVPERKGNRLAFGLQNLLARPQIGLLFLVPGTGETLRVEGTATLGEDPEVLALLTARGAPALLALRVSVTRCLFHCARAFKRSRLWEPGTWPAAEAFSFGRIIAREMGEGEEAVREIDARVEDGYRNGL